MARSDPRVEDGQLILPDGEGPARLAVGSAAWFAWLGRAEAFAYAGPEGTFGARKERAGHGRGRPYWRAYRRRDGRLRRVYLGPDCGADPGPAPVGRRLPRRRPAERIRLSDRPASSGASASWPRCATALDGGAGRARVAGAHRRRGGHRQDRPGRGAAAARRRAQGALVLVGRCYDLAETPPYGPWREAFARAPTTTACPPCRRPSCRPSAAGDALGEPGGASSPRVRGLPGRPRRAPARGPAARRPALGRPRLPRPAARRWRGRLADAAPAPPRHLPRRRGRPRPPALRPRCPLLVREARAARLDLRPLDAAAIGALVAARYPLPDADRARRLVALSGRAHRGQRALPGRAAAHARGRGGAAPGRATAGRSATWPGCPCRRCCARSSRGGWRGWRRRPSGCSPSRRSSGRRCRWRCGRRWRSRTRTPCSTTPSGRSAARLLAETPDGAGVRFAHALIREALYEETLGAAPARAAPPGGRGAGRGAHPGPRRGGLPLPAGGRPARVRVARPRRAAGASAGAPGSPPPRASRRRRRCPTGDGARARERGWLLFGSAPAAHLRPTTRGRCACWTRRSPGPGGGRPAAGRPHPHRPRQRALPLRGEIRAGAGGDGAGGRRRWRRCPASTAGGPADQVALATIAALLPEASGATLPTHARTASPAAPGPAATSSNWYGHTGRYREALALGEADRRRRPGRRPGAARCRRPVRARPCPRGAGPAGRGAARRIARCRADLYAAQRRVHGRVQLWSELLLVVLPYQADDLAERARLAAEAARAWAAGAGHGHRHAVRRSQADLPLALLEGRWAEARRLARGRARRRDRSATPRARSRRSGVLARQQGDARGRLGAGARAPPGGAGHRAGRLPTSTTPSRCRPSRRTWRSTRATWRPPGDWIAAHGRWLAWSGAVLWQSDHHRLQARLAAASGDLAAARAHAEAALARATEPRQPLALLAAHRAARRAGHRRRAARRGRGPPRRRPRPGRRLRRALRAGPDPAGAGRGAARRRGAATAGGRRSPRPAPPSTASAPGPPSPAPRRWPPAWPPPPAPPARPPPFGLTAREAEVLRLRGRGRHRRRHRRRAEHQRQHGQQARRQHPGQDRRAQPDGRRRRLRRDLP